MILPFLLMPLPFNSHPSIKKTLLNTQPMQDGRCYDLPWNFFNYSREYHKYPNHGLLVQYLSEPPQDKDVKRQYVFTKYKPILKKWKRWCAIKKRNSQYDSSWYENKVQDLVEAPLDDELALTLYLALSDAKDTIYNSIQPEDRNSYLFVFFRYKHATHETQKDEALIECYPWKKKDTWPDFISEIFSKNTKPIRIVKEESGKKKNEIKEEDPNHNKQKKVKIESFYR